MLGYACINVTLGNRSRTTTEKRLRDLGARAAESHLRELAIANLEDVERVLAWNEAHGIKFFRLSSALFPHMGNTNFKGKYYEGDISFARAVLRRIGAYAARHSHRLTFHAQPYIQLGTPSASVWRKSLFDIMMHYRLFRAMGIVPGPFNCLIVHGGGVYDGMAETLVRIRARLRSLPVAVRRMIVFENDEWHYTPHDLLPVCEEFGLGFCFDMFHNRIHDHPVAVTPAFLRRVLATWPRGTVKMHISEQKTGARKGTHSDRVRRLPDWILRLRPWLMVEAKDKELAVLALKKRYRI